MFRFVSRLSLRCDSFGLLDLLVLCFVCWFSVLSSVCPSVQIPCWDSDPLDMGHMGHMGHMGLMLVNSHPQRGLNTVALCKTSKEVITSFALFRLDSVGTL